MGKAKNINENSLTTEEITKAAFKKFEEWKANQKYKKLYRSMSLEELKDKVLQLNIEKNDFREFLKEKGHNKVEYKFYEYVIMELDKYIKYYMDEIKTIEKIENYITDKGFDVVRVMCSKEFNDLLNEKSNRSSEVPFEFKLIDCINNGLKKLGYTDDEIDELYGISNSDDADSTVEASNFVKYGMNEDRGKCSDISQSVKDDECSNVLMGVDDNDLDEEECDVKYDIDDPTSYMKDDDNTYYCSDPFTYDIVDWGGVITSANTIQSTIRQEATSRNNFEAYLVIDGVDYSHYVDSVTADYMERELMIEIVDEDNGAIPKLVNYWEELYSCDNEVDNGDIIVRTNTYGNKSFETFKDCAIIDFKCSSYVNEDFPRRANLVFSFGKSVTEYCAE